MCTGNSGRCASRSHPVWEMVINELDRRDDPKFDETLPGCTLVDSCTNIATGEQFGQMLKNNFDRHFSTNAPRLASTSPLPGSNARRNSKWPSSSSWTRCWLATTSTSSPCSRSSNGCKTPPNWPVSETSRNGKRNATSRANPSALCPTLALSPPENCQERSLDCTLAWSAPELILGSSIPLVRDSTKSRNRYISKLQSGNDQHYMHHRNFFQKETASHLLLDFLAMSVLLCDRLNY